jgi:two-component system, NtrC family, response regulator AtoC
LAVQAPKNGHTILVGEDELEVRGYLEIALESLGYEVELAQDGEEVVNALRSPKTRISAVLLDLMMQQSDGMETLQAVRQIAPDLPVIIVSGSSSTSNIVAAMKCGATDFLCSPVAHEDLKAAIANAINDQMAREHTSPARPTKTTSFIGRSPQIKQILSLVPMVGWSEAPVLIQGETGSGKEVLARELHTNSPRADGPFLKLNCAALPSELVESELFGYERGAFTGAFQKKAGMFEMASRGTILLDEIGDMDVRLQAKLLHVLQDHEFQRIGGKEMVKVNVRVIAATHQDLERAIGERRFREDLYYRLNVINLQLPPLRERKDDILPLAQHLIGKHSPAGTPALNITMDLTHALLAYHWPGNVRELENVMRRLVVLRNPTLILNELKARTARKPAAAASIGGFLAGPSETALDGGGDPTPILEQVTKAKQQAEAEAILAALNSTRWNRKQAAALLKIDYKALLYKMKKLGVEDDVLSIAGSTNESPSRAAVAGG